MKKMFVYITPIILINKIIKFPVFIVYLLCVLYFSDVEVVIFYIFKPIKTFILDKLHDMP